MACDKPLIFLSCDSSGQARTAQAVNINDTVIQLMRGQGSRFPEVPNGKWFYIRVVGCDSCCETMRVVGRDGDKLHVQRGFGTQCTCIKSNSLITYTTDTQYFHLILYVAKTLCCKHQGSLLLYHFHFVML